jgi:hypothetical protein
MRPLWFGLVTFDRTWLWTPTAVGGAFDDPQVSHWSRDCLADCSWISSRAGRSCMWTAGTSALWTSSAAITATSTVAAGSHTIEILATDYEPLAFDIAISPRRTTTYRGSLQRAERRD